MSLTRIQWKEMWHSVRVIERAIQASKLQKVKKDSILAEIDLIKNQIQFVIGQQE